MFHKFIVGDDACLFEAIHDLANIHVEKTFVIYNVLQVVRIDNFLGDDADVYLHVFWLRQIIVEIKVFNICDEALSVGCRNDAVKEKFGCGDCSGWGCEGAFVI